jgi:hypothetical protein
MEIKLYLKKINQEMIKRTKDVKDSVAGCDVYVSWTKSCCILDFGYQDPNDLISNPLKPGLILRKEDIGGLIWNAKTGTVYQVDEEAYHTILELENGFSEIEIAKKMKLPLKKVHSFRNKLLELS